MGLFTSKVVDAPRWKKPDESPTIDLIVEFTGDQVNVRNQPGLDGEIVDVLPRGTAALYLNACEVDERGVAWYSIRTNGGPCWVSSKYAKIR